MRKKSPYIYYVYMGIFWKGGLRGGKPFFEDQPIYLYETIYLYTDHQYNYHYGRVGYS